MGLFLFACGLTLVSLREVMDIILLSGAPIGPIVKLLLCRFPELLTLSLPIGCLLGGMLVYGRLAEDNELVAMRAAGVRTYSVLLPGLVLGVFLTWLNFYWTANVTPLALERFENQQREMIKQMTSAVWIKPGQFNEIHYNFALYVNSAQPGSNTINGVSIFMSGGEEGMNPFGGSSSGEEVSDWIVSAPTATIIPKPIEGFLEISLEDAVTENFRPDKQSRVNINSMTVTVDIAGRLNKDITKDSSERRHWKVLLAEADKDRNDIENIFEHLGLEQGISHGLALARAKAWSEGAPEGPEYKYDRDVYEHLRGLIKHAQRKTNQAMMRLTYPAGTFVFMLIGMPLGILAGRGKRTVSIIITVGIIVLYYAIEKTAEGVSENFALTSRFDPGFAMWTPNILYFLVGLALTIVIARQ